MRCSLLILLPTLVASCSGGPEDDVVRVIDLVAQGATVEFEVRRGQTVRVHYALADVIGTNGQIAGVAASCGCTSLQLHSDGNEFELSRLGPGGELHASRPGGPPVPLAELPLETGGSLVAAIDTTSFPRHEPRTGNIQVVTGTDVVSLQWRGRVTEFYALEPAEIVCLGRTWDQDVELEARITRVGDLPWQVCGIHADPETITTTCTATDGGLVIRGRWPAVAIGQPVRAGRIEIETTLGRITVLVRVETSSVFEVTPGRLRLVSRTAGGDGMQEEFRITSGDAFRCVDAKVVSAPQALLAVARVEAESDRAVRVVVDTEGGEDLPLVNVAVEVTTDHPFESTIPLRLLVSRPTRR